MWCCGSNWRWQCAKLVLYSLYYLSSPKHILFIHACTYLSIYVCIICMYVCFGHTQLCSALTPSSVLRDHSYWRSGDPVGWWELTQAGWVQGKHLTVWPHPPHAHYWIELCYYIIAHSRLGPLLSSLRKGLVCPTYLTFTRFRVQTSWWLLMIVDSSWEWGRRGRCHLVRFVQFLVGGMESWK